MPSYDFECRSCGKRFVAKVPISERGSVRCPGCAGGDLKQLITGCGFVTGSGSKGQGVAAKPAAPRFT